MVNTIDMQDMRYINLFGKITGVNTRYCFKYNEAIIFSVPKNMIAKAVGEKGKNVKKISEILGKRIKIIASPEGIEDAKVFIEAIVNPVGFKELEINGSDEIVITAGPQNKAALLGRNKRRLIELQSVAKGYFKKELRIV
jgi:NusA-like KH domain protein